MVDEVEVLVDTGVLEDSTEDGVSDEEVLRMVEDEEVLAAVGTVVDELVSGTTDDELELDTAATLELELEGTTVELAAAVVDAKLELATLVKTLDVSSTMAEEVLCAPPISIDALASWSVSLYAAPALSTSPCRRCASPRA